MHYDAILNDHGLKSDPFKACVGPRPIAWISTVGTDGRDNPSASSTPSASTRRWS